MKSVILEIKTLAEILGISPLSVEYVTKHGKVTRAEGPNANAQVLSFQVPNDSCLLITDLDLDSALLDGTTPQENARLPVMHTPESTLYWSYGAPDQSGEGVVISSPSASYFNFATATGTTFIMFEGGKNVRLWISEDGLAASVGMRLNVMASGYLLPDIVQEKLANIAATLS
jgi:hypothetical protein